MAKLDGFLSDPHEVMQRRTSDSVPDRYARAVAYYRMPDPQGAGTGRRADRRLSEGSVLLRDEGPDPVRAMVAKQFAPYREALHYRPNSALHPLRAGAGADGMAGRDEDLTEAAAMLREVVRIEPHNGGAWRFLGIAEGRLGNEGAASLALAEQAVLMGNRKDAEFYLRRAEQIVQPGDPDWFRLQDLSRAVDDIEEPPQRAAMRPL